LVQLLAHDDRGRNHAVIATSESDEAIQGDVELYDAWIASLRSQ
jgi:hypothetical protein